MTEGIVTQKNSQISPVKSKIDLGEIENNAKQSNKLDIGMLESIFIKGDISSMTEIERINYTKALCRSLGLNPLTQPFDYISFQGKITLYAKKCCTDQLRSLYSISISLVSQVLEEGLLVVTARAEFPDGRKDEDIGCVSIQGLKGDSLANAKMKAVTKAKRRVTLSICGLGILDETETETMPGARTLKDFDQPKVEIQAIAAPRPASPPTVAESKAAGVISDKPSENQMKRLWAIAGSARVSEAEIHKYIEKHFKKLSLKEINFTEYREICDVWLPTAKADIQAQAMTKAVEAVSSKDTDEFDAFPPMEEPPTWVK